MYESILKLLKVNDSISIPIEYYKKLCVKHKRNVFISMDCTRYTAISEIRLASKALENILAIVDYNELAKDVRITILKEFDNNMVSEDDISILEVKYNKWKRNNSFIT